MWYGEEPDQAFILETKQAGLQEEQVWVVKQDQCGTCEVIQRWAGRLPWLASSTRPNFTAVGFHFILPCSQLPMNTRKIILSSIPKNINQQVLYRYNQEWLYNYQNELFSSFRLQSCLLCACFTSPGTSAFSSKFETGDNSSTGDLKGNFPLLGFPKVNYRQGTGV